MRSAIATLAEIYAQRAMDAAQERPLIGFTSNTVPWELLRAAGFQPILLSPRKTATPLADRYMEDVFSSRIKAIFDFLLSPDAAVLRAVVIPRSSEQEHKLFLYLREVVRQGAERTPQPIIYNLLHTRSAEARSYGLERTRELKAVLERLSGRPIESEALKAAIAESNQARQAIRGLLQMREGPEPKLAGSEALGLIAAWHFMDRTEYARLAREARQEIESRRPFGGPRILIKGAPQDQTDFCAGVESHGATVVAEDDWWGSRAAGRDIDEAGEPLQAIFEKYYLDAPSPRVFPAAIADEWFCWKAKEVDGVIFYLPSDDDVLGWDYPRLAAFLDERNIPHLMLPDACAEKLQPFLGSLSRG